MNRGQPMARAGLASSTQPAAPAPRRAPRSTSTDIPDRVRKLVYRRDHNTCARCGRPALEGNRQVQHRQPRGMGGRGRKVDAHRLSMLVLMCGYLSTDPNGCHAWAEGEVEEAKTAGFRVRPGLDPTTVPVDWFDGERYYLHDDGSRTRAETTNGP